jgi:hypothetical protein
MVELVSSLIACMSSKTRRLFPIPGTPTSVTSCGERSARKSVLQEVEFPLAAHERRGGMPNQIRAEPGLRVQGMPHLDRAAFPFERDRLGLAVVDHVPRRAICLLIDQDSVRRRGCLQSRRGVDDVS